MADPVIARKNYHEVDLGAGKEYWWCACGRSQSQPFCDGAHKGGEFRPKMVKVEQDLRLYLCGCKQTTDAPYCDGTHAGL